MDIESVSDDNIDIAENAKLQLSPFSVIMNILLHMRSMMFSMIAVTVAFGSGTTLFYLVILIILTIVYVFFDAWFSWKRFTYQIATEEILIESGIFSRNARSIPYERIQDVNVEQNLLARIFNIASVKFETGGSEGEEGKLNYVTLDEAENLRQLVRSRKMGLAPSAIAPDIASEMVQSDHETIMENDTDDIIFSMGIKRIFTLSIFNFSLVLFAIIIGVMQQLEFLLPYGVEDIIEFFSENIAEKTVRNSEFMRGFTMANGFFGVVGGMFVIIIIGILSGQVQTFLREYGFILTATDRGIRRRRGLLTLTDVVMPLHRVQAVIVQTGAIRKYFGWYALKFTSLGSDTGTESSHMMAPLAKDYEYWPIANRASIHAPSDDTIFAHSHFSYAAASIIFSLFLIAIIFTLSMILPQMLPADKAAISLRIFGWIWFIALLPLLFGYIGWRHHYHAIDDDQIYVKSGFWNQKMTILPLINVQSVDLVQGPLSQFLGVSDVKFGIAGGRGLTTLTIHNVPLSTAHYIRMASIKTAREVDFSALIRAPQYM